MRTSFLRVVACCLLLCAAAQPVGHAADWQPAPFPLMTRWASEVTPQNVHSEYPRPQLVRKEWLNLNGLWDYAMVNIGQPSTTLPTAFAGKIMVPFPLESSLSGVRKSLDGRLWYQRSFVMPSAWSGDQRILLHFGAVDWETEVFINGTVVGKHRGGYDAFTIDITAALQRKDPDQAQTLTLSVLNPTGGPLGAPHGKQMQGSLEAQGGLMYSAATGIWQTVWLEPVAPTSIARLKIVPQLDAKTVQVTAFGLDGSTGDALARVEVLDGSTSIASGEGALGTVMTLSIPQPKAWSPDAPFLYDLKVSLSTHGKTVDAVSSYFGMRKIALGTDANGAVRILLNDQPIFQVGPLDQGYWPDGIYTAPTDDALRYDIEAIKKLGCNVSRKHAKVEPDRWYYWCDKLGLLVWQDMPGGGVGHDEKRISDEAATQFEAELTAMFDGLYDHPSVIMWILFNEGWGQYDTERLTQWARTYDPSRLISAISCGPSHDVGDIIDDHPYWVPNAPKGDGKRAVVIGEFGGRAMVVPGHVVSDKHVWGHPGGTILAGPWELTTHYIQLMRTVYKEKEEHGLDAAIFTQLTDVEAECNGMLTYDRAVVKVDPKRIVDAFQGRFAPRTVFTAFSPVATKPEETVIWRYTTDQPADGWEKPGFDDSAWKQGPAPFGSSPRERTEWRTPDIWIRREFTIPDAPMNRVQLLGNHAEDGQVYLNGVLANKLTGYTLEYQEYQITDESRATLKPGSNLICVHGHHPGHEQHFDFGVVDRSRCRRLQNRTHPLI